MFVDGSDSEKQIEELPQISEVSEQLENGSNQEPKESVAPTQALVVPIGWPKVRTYVLVSLQWRQLT